MHVLENHPPKVINLRDLQGVNVNRKIFARAQRLYKKGHVRQNPHYSWLFTVSGGRSPEGLSLYFVNLAEFSCACLWFKNTGQPCKHLIAALLLHMENTTPKI
jgi:hypothetical protein